MADSYRTVTTCIRNIRPAAVLIDKPRGGETWIPRSLIHGADDLNRIEHAFIGEEITFRLMEWKAEEIGFA